MTNVREDELFVAAKELQAPYDLVVRWPSGKLPVTLFTAGGIATPADAAMMMQLGAEVGLRGLAESSSPAILPSGPPHRPRPPRSTTTPMIGQVSRGLGEAMVGIDVEQLAEPHRLSQRGW